MSAIRIASWSFVALFSLAFTGWFIARDADLLKLDAKTLINMVDITITDFDMQQYDEKGNLQHQLLSPNVEHVPANDTYHLDRPHLIVTNKKNETWLIDAVVATAIEHGETITLKKDVRIEEKSNALSIQTNELTYHSNTQEVDTNQPISIKQPDKEVHANGMQANMNNKTIKLYNQSRGQYAAPTA